MRDRELSENRSIPSERAGSADIPDFSNMHRTSFIVMLTGWRCLAMDGDTAGLHWTVEAFWQWRIVGTRVNEDAVENTCWILSVMGRDELDIHR
jgi:hypothetical protein